MKVELLTYTNNIEDVITSAGKLCYSKVGISDILKKSTPEDNERFIKMLSDMGHHSPLEHVSFTFAIEGVSRALTHQLVRHRIASYSQQSQRYVSLDKTFEYITPPVILNDDELKYGFDHIMNVLHNAYIVTSENLKVKYLEKGMNERDASKKAIEDARYLLPNACETKIVVTMNVRTLLHFFEKRCCSRAQWEIREMANKMLKLCNEISPTLFSLAGPTCKKGYCNEGKMSCNPKYRK